MPANRLEKRSDQISFNGRILFLTEDTALIRKQLEATGDEAQRIEDELAARLANEDLPLMSNISTDEITPGWVCFYYDETLGQYVYVGMREGAVQERRSEERRLCRRRLRAFERLRLFTRDGALRGEGGRHSTRHRPEH